MHVSLIKFIAYSYAYSIYEILVYDKILATKAIILCMSTFTKFNSLSYCTLFVCFVNNTRGKCMCMCMCAYVYFVFVFDVISLNWNWNYLSCWYISWSIQYTASDRSLFIFHWYSIDFFSIWKRIIINNQ